MPSLLPITAKLNPFGGVRNLCYLLEAAVLTRFATSFVRIWQNKPDKLNDPRLSANQKRQALGERIFVELLGTMGYILSLHLGQDLVAKLLEWGRKIPEITRTDKLGADEVKIANEAIREVFGESSKGLISRIIYGHPVSRDGKTVVQKATLTSLREVLRHKLGNVKLGDALFDKVRDLADGKGVKNFIEKFTRSGNIAASMSILCGVAISALFGGLVTQWMNDRKWAPYLKKRLVRHFGDDSKPGQRGFGEQSPLSAQVSAPAYMPVAPQLNVMSTAYPMPTQAPMAAVASAQAPGQVYGAATPFRQSPVIADRPYIGGPMR